MNYEAGPLARENAVGDVESVVPIVPIDGLNTESVPTS